VPLTRAGLPPTTARAGTSRVTTDPAPTSASSPITTPGSTVTLAPSLARRPTRTPRMQALTSGQRGMGALVSTTRGPSQQSSSSTDSSGTNTPVCIRTRWPTRTWCSSTDPDPSETSSPISLSSRTSTPWPVWKRSPIRLPA
jgi:hypothetical protein